MTTRRDFLATAAVGALAAGCASTPDSAPGARAPGAFRYALNPATIRPFKLPLREQVRLCIAAGYDGIEPWLADMRAAKAELRDIRKMCEDGNLAVVNGIGFAHWSLPDAAARRAGMDEMKADMALVAELGGRFIAAPPFGLQPPGSPKVSLDAFADGYRAVLELGGRMGVTPILEFWGHSANLSRLNEALYVAAASGHAEAAVLADVYHMYRGGSPYEGLRFCTKSTLPVLHMNDVPATPARAQLKDADRVWPGDGIAPWRQIKGILRENGLSPWLSLELFNASYCTTTPLETLQTGLRKMKSVLS